MKRRASTMPAWPLHLRRAQERAALGAVRREARFAWALANVTRDASLVALVGFVVVFLVWVSR